MITTSFTQEQEARLCWARATVDDVSHIVNRTYKRNGDGEFSSGSGGDDESSDAGAREPSVIATARGGGHSVARFDDPDGAHLGTTLEPAQYVAIGSGSQFGTRRGLADADFAMPAEHAAGVADAMDSVSAKSKTIAAPTDPHAFDDGPTVLVSETAGPYHVTAFHDGNGDMSDEGGRFVQVTDRTDFHDSLGGGSGDQLTVDAGDVAGVTGAIRKVAT